MKVTAEEEKKCQGPCRFCSGQGGKSVLSEERGQQGDLLIWCGFTVLPLWAP